MKTLLPACFFLLFITPAIMKAQAPQGINYQAIALDASSNPVSNQPIGLRLSVLDGSATGPVVYSETQNPSTDNTGLFSVVIGNGIPASGTFSGINWGSGYKWLKTEIDIAGGTSYVLMGVTQFMSVPYSLYSNMSASSASFEHPDGLNNITPVLLLGTPYTVPAGKNLYVNADFVKIDTLSFSNYMQSSEMLSRPFVGASAGSIVKTTGAAFLVDALVEWKSINITCNPFTVPAGKIFIIAAQHLTNGSTHVMINGTALSTFSNLVNYVLKAGDVLSTDGTCSYVGTYYVNGYLKSN